MNSRLLNKEVLAGLPLVVVGVVGFVGAKAISSPADAVGSVFSKVVCASLAFTGIVITTRGFISARERLAPIPLRSCAAVIASVLAFAALIERLGLAAAVVAAVMASSLGFRHQRLRDGIIFGICMAAVMFILFVGLLGQSIKLAPGF